MKSAAKWQAHALTHRGLVRRANEDACFCDPTRGLLVVADGMGGYVGGQLASRTTVETIVDFVESVGFGKPNDFPSDPSPWEMKQLARAALSAANVAVLEARFKPGGGEDMGSTAVVLLLEGNRVHGGSIGDSRAYLIGEGVFRRLTHDHTLAQEAEDSGTPVDRLDGGNCLVKCIGDSKLGEPSYFSVSLSAGQRILICTDGLTDMLPEAEIANVVERAANPAEACNALIGAALDAGGEDNVTAIVAQLSAARTVRVDTSFGLSRLASIFKG